MIPSFERKAACPRYLRPMHRLCRALGFPWLRVLCFLRGYSLDVAFASETYKRFDDI